MAEFKIKFLLNLFVLLLKVILNFRILAIR